MLAAPVVIGHPFAFPQIGSDAEGLFASTCEDDGADIIAPTKCFPEHLQHGFGCSGVEGVQHFRAIKRHEDDSSAHFLYLKTGFHLSVPGSQVASPGRKIIRVA